MQGRLHWLVIILPALAWVSLGAVPLRAQQLPPVDEVQIDNPDLQKLDQFESHVLNKADKVFNEKDYRRAAAEYDSFMLEYPRSSATAYALLRKARSLHLDGKRSQALREYQEVLDYFPNQVTYATAALYYMGQAHQDAGDPEKAVKFWARLADDKQYSRHPLAAGAINGLALQLQRMNHPDKAGLYFQQVAIDFRKSNPEVARFALSKAVEHFILTQPNEPNLRNLYAKAGGFAHHPRAIAEDPATLREYWDYLIDQVPRLDRFTKEQVQEQKQYYQYWATALNQARLPADPPWDDLPIAQAQFQYRADGDFARFSARLDQLFNAQQKSDDMGRVVRWIGLYAQHKAKWNQYYQKLKFDKMSNGHLWALVQLCYESLDDRALADNTFSKLKLGEFNDQQRYQMIRWLWEKNDPLPHIRALCQSASDKDWGRMELLRFLHWQYWHWKRGPAPTEGTAVADELAKSANHAREALYLKGQILQRAGQFEQAINAYNQSDSPPESVFRIAECLVSMRKHEQAIAQLRELENFFEKAAPEAALRIAYVQRDAGQKDRFIASLRGVLKKYPKSSQSSSAHQELEALGIKIGGGVHAD